ncbi:MAG TPA: hypothetical protein VL096_20585, partial [Pirellulaceae bacterium]|nr:hypothetical protein [Pirellulaceae bacterium]
LRSLAAYRIHHGRVVVDTGHFGGGVTMTGPRPSLRERLVMHDLAGDARIHYQQSSWREEVSLKLVRGPKSLAWEVELLRRPRGRATAPFVWYLQQPNQPITLRVKSQTYQADSLWQLWLEQPDICQVYLQPLLCSLRPNWPLHATAVETQRSVVTLQQIDSPARRALWQTYVNELGSDRASERAHGYRELLAAEPAVLVFLSQLKHEELDAEQRYQLKTLCEPSQPTEEDTPTSAAVSLYQIRGK